jgi:hypothetical protein
MSFILDALKKLEREKESREPGVVMVGPVPWGGADRRSRRRRLAFAAAALVLVGALGIWWVGVSPGPSAPETESREGTSSGGSFDRPEVVPAGAAAPAPRPSRPPAEEPPAPRTAEAPGPAPGRGAAVRPPGARTLDLPVEQTAPAARSEPGATSEAATTAPADIDRAASERNVAAGAEPSAASSAAVAGEVPPPPGSLAAVAEAETPPEETAETGLSEAPDAPSAPPGPEFRLTAISTRDGEPIALLNDRLVREGDRFGDVRIIRIGTTEVEIEVDGERRTIGF